MKNFLGREDDNPLVIDALLAMGLPSPSCMPLDCVRVDLPLILKHALLDTRVEITPNDIIPFSTAIDLDRTEMLQILLSSPRTITDKVTINWLLSGCVREDKEKCVAILLADTRTEPTTLCVALSITRWLEEQLYSLYCHSTEANEHHRDACSRS